MKLKNFVSILILLFFYVSSQAVNPKESPLKDRNKTELTSSDSDNPIPDEGNSPGRIHSFWWSFIISAIGAYTLWGLVAGPISVLIVYFSSKRSKKEVRRSLWGWLAGTAFGIGIWLLVKLL